MKCMYCFRIPDAYSLASAAPLLCAGITVYSPMMRHKMNQPGKSLGVIGLGGLGHMAVKFGKALGLNVTVFSTSISKKEESLTLLVMKSISGSVVGGTKETQEMLDFCAAHKIYPNIEIIPIQYVNEAIERLIKKDVKYRFVVYIENSLK
ncbi:hypothetical protein GBA52_011085 [Prunus armeniaca]|nr:hypothetical protein GBA52_011085 [Prunus armeniaca]